MRSHRQPEIEAAPVSAATACRYLPSVADVLPLNTHFAACPCAVSSSDGVQPADQHGDSWVLMWRLSYCSLEATRSIAGMPALERLALPSLTTSGPQPATHQVHHGALYVKVELVSYRSVQYDRAGGACGTHYLCQRLTIRAAGIAGYTCALW